MRTEAANQPDSRPDLFRAGLPTRFASWFREKGWQLYPHQQDMLDRAKAGDPVLLIAPTGAGKTLSGFLPSLLELAERPPPHLHTLYISPLKALAVDIARNLTGPVAEMGLAVRIESRTGDTPANRRARQRHTPPHILLTTPESLELMLAWPEAADWFAGLQTVIIDEIHTLAGNKRGDLLSLSLAVLRSLAPQARFVGLSATLADPAQMTGWLHPEKERVAVLAPPLEKQMQLSVYMPADQEIPWAGHSCLWAVPEIYRQIEAHKTSLIFVNTRAQAEMLFQALWQINEKGLKIGLHHGSLATEQRRKTEAAMAAGKLDAVVATSSLDLGIDWAEIDLVMQVGAPKGTARLIQRMGRAGHQLNAVSRAIIFPANRFEIFEALAAQQTVQDRELERLAEQPGALDVLAQHIVGRAVAGPFFADQLYQQVTTAPPFAGLARAQFDRVLDFVATGGNALEHYSQFQRLVCGVDGAWRITGKQVATRWRMNIGTIVESATLKVRLKGGPVLGEIEEYFIQALRPQDSFIFAGQILEFIGLQQMTAEVRRTSAAEPKIPAYAGGRLPLSANLADRVRQLLQDDQLIASLPEQIRFWTGLQKQKSALPDPHSLLVETFRRSNRHYMIAYGFAGRNAHQTLGMLLTRRMERSRLEPLGFVANDYALAIWTRQKIDQPQELFDMDILGDDLEEWMAESSMLKRCFRQVATIAGLIDQNLPGTEKTGRQVTINSDLIYDVLRRHQPDHLLLEATRQDAARSLTDIKRLADLLQRFSGAIKHIDLPRISPLAVPLMLEVGREQVTASGVEAMLDDLQAQLLEEMVE